MDRIANNGTGRKTMTYDTRDHPILILVRGLPGSGKSHLSRALQQALGAKKVVALDPDTTDYESEAYKEHVRQATEEGVDPQLHAYRFLRAQAYDGIAAHKVVIWNQPFTNLEIFRKMIGRLEAHAHECNTELPILVVEVALDAQQARERVRQRKDEGGHGPSEATLTRFESDYQTFAGLEFHTITVRGDDDIDTSVTSVLAELERL